MTAPEPISARASRIAEALEMIGVGAQVAGQTVNGGDHPGPLGSFGRARGALVILLQVLLQGLAK